MKSYLDELEYFRKISRIDKERIHRDWIGPSEELKKFQEKFSYCVKFEKKKKRKKK